MKRVRKKRKRDRQECHQEEISIEVFTWDRLKVEEEQTFGTEFENNHEINTLSRASSNIVNDLNETIGTNVGGNFGIGIPTEYVDLDLGFNGGVNTNVENSLNNTLDFINESTVKSGERFKSTHKVKIIQTRETGEESRTIRRFQNPNSGRTLTLNHFEILENYEVKTNLISYENSKRYCLLVENDDFLFDLDFVLAHQDRLEEVLKSTSYKSGFSAARILAGHRWYLEEGKTLLEINNQNAATETPQPSSNNRNKPFPSGGVFSTATQIKKILKKYLKLSPSKMEKVLTLLAEHHITPPWEDSKYTIKEVQKAQDSVRLYSWWAKVNLVYSGFDSRAQKYVERMNELESVSNLTENELKNSIIVELGLLVDSFDEEWVYNVKMVLVSVIIELILIYAPPAPLGLALGVILGPLVLNPEDSGLSSIISRAKMEIKKYRNTQETVTLKEITGTSSNGADNNNQSGLMQTGPVPQDYSIQDLAKAQADFTALKVHLDSHRIYYQNEIWRSEDPNERFFRLSQKGVAPYIENRLLGFCGKKAIYPLKLEMLPDESKNELTSYGDYNKDKIKELPSEIITLPTPAVHMEAMLGQCDAIEPYLIDRRKIDLELRQAEADQQSQEAKRLEDRLKQEPPLLNNPFGSNESS